VYHGPLMPALFGSMGNTVRWRHWSLVARISFKTGYYFRKTSINYSTLFGSSAGHLDYTKRWQKPGDEEFTDVPSMVYPVNASRDIFYSGTEIQVLKGDHIRLQYINLGYDFNKKEYPKLPLERLNIFFN